MCQGCVDSGRITQRALDACEALLLLHPSASSGPAHIVVEDNNVDDESIRWCLDHWDESVADCDTPELRYLEFRETRDLLLTLLSWPESERVGPGDKEDESASG